MTCGRPTKFEIMRRHRRRVERQRTIAEFEELKEEARAFGYDDTGEVVAALRAPKAPPPAPRRWWWPLAWSTAR